MIAPERQPNICARWLKAQDLEVLRVEKGGRAVPRLHIRYSPLCELFEGAISVYRPGEYRAKHKSVIRFGCEITWDEPHNRARTEQRRTCGVPLLKRMAAALGIAFGGAA